MQPLQRARLTIIAFVLLVAAAGLGVFGAWYGPQQAQECERTRLSFGGCDRDEGMPFYVAAGIAGAGALVIYLALWVAKPAQADT